MQVWNEREIESFLEAAKATPYYALFYTALFTGMRRSEMLALRWLDVDLNTGHATINRTLHQLNDLSYVFRAPKTAKGKRMVALSPSTIQVLKSHKEKRWLDCAMIGREFSDEELVFCQLDGLDIFSL